MGASRGGYVTGENCPRSRFSEAACWAVMAVTATGNTGDTTGEGTSFGHYFAGQDENILLLGEAGLRTPVLPVISPEDMWGVDVKFDDGAPHQGILQAGRHNLSCYTTEGAIIHYDF